MEPCPCYHQEQEVLPVLSQLCAQSMLNDLSPWSGGGDGVLQILLSTAPPIHWVRVGCLSPTLKVSRFLNMGGFVLMRRLQGRLCQHPVLCQWSVVPSHPVMDPVPHTMVPPSQSPL